MVEKKTRNTTVSVELVFKVVETYEFWGETESAPEEHSHNFEILNCELGGERFTDEDVDVILGLGGIYEAIEQELERRREHA